MGAETTSKKFSRLLMAGEEETKRIAHELHHDLPQSMYIIKFDLENAIQQIKNNQANLGIESIQSVIHRIGKTAEQIQTIGMDLWPPTLSDMGILTTISWFCSEFQRRHPGISIDTNIDVQEKDVPDFLKHVIYKILQETLNNIPSHSRANLIHLSLSRRNATVELTIQDSGQGFDIEREVLSGSKLVLCLDSMKERTEIAGGSFTIESAIGKGTIIHASWPI